MTKKIESATPEQWAAIDRLKEQILAEMTQQAKDEDIFEVVRKVWGDMSHTPKAILIADCPILGANWLSILLEMDKLDVRKKFTKNQKAFDSLFGESAPFHSFYNQLMNQLKDDKELKDELNKKAYLFAANFVARMKKDKKSVSETIHSLTVENQAEVNKQLYISIWRRTWSGFYQGGKILGVEYDEALFNLFLKWTQCVPIVFANPTFPIVTRFPAQLHYKENVLHNEKGKSVEFPSGWGWYSLNGVVVPEWLVMTPAEQIDPKRFAEIKNVEIRREFVRKVGIERIWHKNAEVVDKMGEYELGKIEIMEGRTANYLKMHNPSVPEVWHVECVPDTVKTVMEALHERKPEAMKKIPVSEDGEEWYQQGDVCVWPKGAKSLKPLPSVLT